MTKRITVTIKPDGTIVAEASGQPGPACMDDLATIQAMCQGATVKDSRLTPEYFTTPAVRIRNNAQAYNHQTESDS